MGIIEDLRNGFKTLQRLEKEFSELDLKSQVLELRRLLLDAEEALLSKDRELRDLRDQIAKKAATQTRNGFQYPIGTDGRLEKFPLCPACEADGKLVLIVQRSGNFTDIGCPKCGASFDYHVRLEDSQRDADD